MTCKRLHKAERGSNLVEAAIIVPVLLLMLAGVVDFGRAFYDYISIVNAAREGARAASKLPCSNVSQYTSRIYQATYDAAQIRPDRTDDIKLTTSQVTIEPSGTCPLGGALVSVTVTRPFTTMLGGLIGNDFATLNLSSKTVMSRVGRTGQPVK